MLSTMKPHIIFQPSIKEYAASHENTGESEWEGEGGGGLNIKGGGGFGG